MLHDRQSGAALSRAEITAWAWAIGFWLLYAFLVGQIATLRSLTLPCVADGGTTYLADLQHYLFDRSAGRPNFRIMAPLLLAGLEAVANALHHLLFLDATHSAFYQGTPWPLGQFDSRVASCAPRLFVHLFYSGAVLLPVAYAVRAWVATPARRMVLLFLVLWPLMGWPPLLANTLFVAGKLISDWPRAYYLFDATFHTGDLLVLGLVFMTAVVARNMKKPSPHFIVALVAIAQLTNEYLGMMVAFALLAGTIFSNDSPDNHDRRRVALRRFLIAFAASIATAVLGIVVFFAFGGHVNYLSDYSKGPPVNVLNNFAWIRTIIADLITVILPPLIPGVVLGLAFTIRGAGNLVSWRVRQETAILATMFAWFLVVFVIGLFTVDYPSDIGRQFMPAAMLNVLLGFSLARWVVVARYDRMRVSP